MKKGKFSSRERLEHILESVFTIQKFTKDLTWDDFKSDSRTYYACLYQFAVIGEAVMRFDDSILSKHEYPWFKVRAFRNFIMHEYHAVDERVVWDTIKSVLPGFKQMVEQILEQEFS